MVKVRCYAPGCNRYVIPTAYNTAREMLPFWKRLFSKPAEHSFCNEHLERVTSGSFDDNDPNTNPDLGIGND